MSSSTSIVSNRSRNTKSPSPYYLLSSQERTNEDCIQSIVNDINHIVEKYTRELDDTLYKKSTIRSSSIDHISQQKHHSSIGSSYRHNSMDILYEKRYARGMNYFDQKNTYIDPKEYRNTKTIDDPPPLPPKRQIGNEFLIKKFSKRDITTQKRHITTV